MPPDAATGGGALLRDLYAMDYAQGFTVWRYAGRGMPLRRMLVPGFFDSATGHIQRGDHIHLSGADGGMIVVVSGPGQGVNFLVSPILSAAPAPQENACPTIPPARPAPLRLLRRLLRLANPACWSR